MNILIGDDHLLFREGLRRLLETLSPTATFWEAGTFDEILEHIRSETPFDLILIDLQMPGWPGFQGIADLKKQRPQVPIVMVSASESQDHARKALENGASGYIPKSSSVKIMLSALNLVFSGGMYVPPMALQGETGAASHDLLTGEDLSIDGLTIQALTQRQREVLNCLKAGKSNKQIAYELGLSEGTVKIHITAIFRALGVRNRTQAVIAAGDIEKHTETERH